MPDSPVIDARGLRVSFRSRKAEVEALRGLDLSVSPGSLFVLLGPNGAGKTTLMRCVTGLVRPTGGSLSVFGEAEPSGPEVRLRRLGVLIENPGLYGRLDAREYLAFFASFYRIPDIGVRIRGLCGELGLELDGKPVAKLSQGNRQKLQLIRSLLHRPELLLWDEPTDHLDPDSQQAVLGYLKSYLRESGATALVATHRLEQMEEAATHFGFLARGALRASGDRETILAGAAGGGAAVGGPKEGSGDAAERFRLGFARPVWPEELAWPLGEFAAAGEPAGADGRHYEIRGAGLGARMPELIRALVLRDLPLASVEPRRTTLA